MNDSLITDVYGYVKTWNGEKGYGWIRVPGLRPEDNNDEYTDVFIHAAEVKSGHFVGLGACVSCDVFRNDDGWRVADGAEVVESEELPEEFR
jgi:cold shock CspA family protein